MIEIIEYLIVLIKKIFLVIKYPGYKNYFFTKVKFSHFVKFIP